MVLLIPVVNVIHSVQIREIINSSICKLIITAVILLIAPCPRSVANMHLGTVIQSIVSLMGWLRGQFLKCFTTL